MMRAHASLVQTNPGPARPSSTLEVNATSLYFLYQQYKVMLLHTFHTEEWYLLRLEFSSVAIN